jgi:hypothetical protein
MNDDLDISILSDFSKDDLYDLIQSYESSKMTDDLNIISEDKPDPKIFDISKMDSINNLFNGFDILNMNSMTEQINKMKSSDDKEELNIGDYFEKNKLKDRQLTRDDTITVSLKEPNGEYRAVFATLGDIIDFIYSELKKKENING